MKRQGPPVGATGTAGIFARGHRIGVRRLARVLVLAGIASAWPLALSAQASATTITLTVSRSTLVASGGDTATLTATVTQGSGNPVVGDTVTFTSTDGGQTIAPKSVATGADGVATATLTSSKTLGTSSITAGDASVTSSPAEVTQTVGPPATMTLTLEPSTIVADRISTTTATATVSDAWGHAIDDSPVRFSSSDPGQVVGATIRGVNHSYTAAIRSSTTPGLSTITASDGGSVTRQATLKQVSGPTTVSLVASQSKAVTNETVALWANISAPGGQPSGTVTFTSGGTALPNCAGKPITPTHAVATCQASFAAASSRVAITATFSPDGGSDAAGASASTALDVTRASTLTTLTGPASARTGQRTTYVATVSPASDPGPVRPSGSVTFFDNRRPIASCTSARVQGRRATCSVTYKTAGWHRITARYSGDANFTGSSTAARSVNVAQPPPRGIVSATMQWTFRYAPAYTTILQFGITGATDTAITIGCHGRGCPFTRRTVIVRKTRRCGRRLTRACPTRGKADLGGYFRGRRLAPGAKITVLISRKGWVGKDYAFTIRARRGPAVAIGCVAPGATRPASKCST